MCGVSAAHAQQSILLEAPRGGWNYSGVIDRPQDTAVAYPTPPIDRGAQSHRSAIKGRILEAGKDRRPPTLVVNGNAMPLYTGEGGRFARYYAFGAGSNSIEVKTDASSKRVQFYEANSGKTAPQLRVILSWNAPGAEIDMHVLTPDGGHAFWARPVLDAGGGLDVDSVDGPGPEIFSITAPPRGIYHLYVNYWGNLGAGGYHFDESTREVPVIEARITLVTYENTPREKRETFVVPLRKIGDLLPVKSFLF
jgi:uncharacterized protein YfaP (DUF2135 family)